MLERIHEEKWRDLRTQMTDASSIPEAILALLSDSEEEFEKAYWKIENHVVVQSDLYSAAAVVPKYLEEVYLKSKFKNGVSELLFQIGSGYSTDIDLMRTCFNEVVRVYNSLLANPSIQGTEFVTVLEEDLLCVIELHNDQSS
ncbi:hypothetical protein A7985_07365 [Pseudoalteromonas luteoviolacea]|uniref:Uncharacterized protein n=1 Tax=Pseudoalteromonas luteoviolacea TaxID=43657 RepID=A0A1C0TWQ3_9GAMM|nr:hypothetical protein [Pseudoalteromonas luteoviolacea]OCQ23750.1 hypothetical protein A7985_07365 [Pseudoalteromonas luteoviolacea]